MGTARFTVLRHSRIEPHFARPEVHVAPFKPEDFGDPPTGQVGELDDRSKIDGQVLEDGTELVYLEEPHYAP
jgi:hypothetical protein